MKSALVLGAGGFVGSHLVKRLKKEGFWVRGVDLKMPEFSETHADDFVIGDLREQTLVRSVIDRKFDEVYQLAADMGGAGYIFVGENDADIVYNSAQINLNVIEHCRRRNVRRVLFTSSACIYSNENQTDPDNPNCEEGSAYPANPDSDYGWEKLFSERVYSAYRRNYGMATRIARYHNIFGPEGTWNGGKEKAPAALCRKVAKANDGSNVEIWGDGFQTRSFLFIDECIEGTIRLMRSDFHEPVNIGSEEMISIRDLAQTIIDISGKDLEIRCVPGPQGVRGRTSDNRLIRQVLNWEPKQSLKDGLKSTYDWIERQIKANA